MFRLAFRAVRQGNVAFRRFDRLADFFEVAFLLIVFDIRFNRAGADDVDAGFMFGEFERGALSKGDLPRLGNRISRRARIGEITRAVDRSRNDNRAFLFFKEWTI